MIEHSPTPWRLSDQYDEELQIVDANGEPVVSALIPFVRAFANPDANLDHILRCVNAYPGLVAACEVALDQDDETIAFNLDFRMAATARAQIEVALAKAKGEENLCPN